MTEKQWTNKITNLLVGREIINVEYMTDKETKELMWDSKPICLLLRDVRPINKKGDRRPDVWIYPSMDDEGNNAGALFTTEKDLPTIPVIHEDLCED